MRVTARLPPVRGGGKAIKRTQSFTEFAQSFTEKSKRRFVQDACSRNMSDSRPEREALVAFSVKLRVHFVKLCVHLIAFLNRNRWG